MGSKNSFGHKSAKDTKRDARIASKHPGHDHDVSHDTGGHVSESDRKKTARQNSKSEKRSRGEH